MRKIKIPFSQTHQFSTLIDDYLSGNPALKPFYSYSPSLDAFKEAIEVKQKNDVNREVLFSALQQQYKKLLHSNPSSAVSESLSLLKEKTTFTVTTGHQLNIFTGPLYSLYKIATVVKLAQELKSKYTEYNFVPVFWMASEDHDFEEINHISVYGKTVTWNSNQKGAVGRMKTEGFEVAIDQLKEIIGVDSDVVDMMANAYLNAETMTEATRTIVHNLFCDYGLVIIDGDDEHLKRLFIDEMKNEIVEGKSFTAIEETNKLFSKNYKIQVTPREINLFYLKDEVRERVSKIASNQYEVLNTSIKFTEAEILNELEAYPERFSPNVVMRPLYQEKILPNLAYIGGPGELNYWFQFKSAFETYNIPYPVVMLRNCMMLVDSNASDKLNKLGVEVNEIFQSADALILKILENSAEFHPGTDKQAAVVQKIYTELANEFSKLDASLVPAIEGEKQKVLNGLKNLEDKGMRSLKRKNETILNQLKNVRGKLIPDGALQERVDNFIPYSIKSSNNFVDDIVSATEPFANEFIILIED